MKKKTVSIKEEQGEFLQETGINASKVLRQAINHLRTERMTDRDIAMLKRFNEMSEQEFKDMEVVEE